MPVNLPFIESAGPQFRKFTASAVAVQAVIINPAEEILLLSYPENALLLPAFLQGYEKNNGSALAILSFLDQHFEINPGIKEEILRLCQ